MICVVISMIICVSREKQFENLKIFNSNDDVNLPEQPSHIASLKCDGTLVDLHRLNEWFTALKSKMFTVTLRDRLENDIIVSDFTAKGHYIRQIFPNVFETELNLEQLRYLIAQPSVRYIDCDSSKLPEQPSQMASLLCAGTLVDMTHLDEWFTNKKLNSIRFIVMIRDSSDLGAIVNNFTELHGTDPIRRMLPIISGFSAELNIVQLKYLLAQPGVRSIECDSEISINPQLPNQREREGSINLPHIPSQTASLICDNKPVDTTNMAPHAWFTALNSTRFMVTVRDSTRLNAIRDNFAARYDDSPIRGHFDNGFTADLDQEKLRYLLAQPGVRSIECARESSINPQHPNQREDSVEFPSDDSRSDRGLFKFPPDDSRSDRGLFHPIENVQHGTYNLW
jgi:hypothetical protein